jgi:hypothetical protein
MAGAKQVKRALQVSLQHLLVRGATGRRRRSGRCGRTGACQKRSLLPRR